MLVRPFYVRAVMRDERNRELGLGPSGLESGMDVTITQRSENDIVTAFTISSHTFYDSGVLKLSTAVMNCNGTKVAEHITTY